jgi:hypothetical protein
MLKTVDVVFRTSLRSALTSARGVLPHSGPSLAFILLAAVTTTLAQVPGKGQLSFTIADRQGAAMGEARIAAFQVSGEIPADRDWHRYTSTRTAQLLVNADRDGKADFALPKGRYVISLFAPGFEPNFKLVEVEDSSSHVDRVVLDIDQHFTRYDCMACRGPEFPLWSTSLSIWIPREPFPVAGLAFTHAVSRKPLL